LSSLRCCCLGSAAIWESDKRKLNTNRR
jgi:hypothetical protein